MGVVFDEVITQVETPPAQVESAEQQSDTAQPPQLKSREWQQQQSTFWRRAQRLEAD